MSILQIPRRAMMGSAEGGFGFVAGSYPVNEPRIIASSNTEISVVLLERWITVAIPLTAVPVIKAGDSVAITFTRVSGDEISGRYACKFGGITVVGNKTVSNWGGLTTTTIASADASTAEFTIYKDNTGTYHPSNPPTVKVSVAVNGVTIM